MIQTIGLIVWVYVMMRAFQSPIFATLQSGDTLHPDYIDKLTLKIKVSSWVAFGIECLLGLILLTYGSEGR